MQQDTASTGLRALATIFKNQKGLKSKGLPSHMTQARLCNTVVLVICNCNLATLVIVSSVYLIVIVARQVIKAGT